MYHGAVLPIARRPRLPRLARPWFSEIVSNNDRHVATPTRTFTQRTMPLADPSKNPVLVTD